MGTTVPRAASSESPSAPEPDWTAAAPVRRFQLPLLLVGALSLLLAALFALLRLVPPTDDATAMVASFIPYGLLAGIVALGCLGLALLRARRRGVLVGLTILSAVLCGAQVVWQAPLFVADDRPAVSPGFTLLSLNTHKGEADAVRVTELAAQADVVVLAELTPAGLARLDRAGFRDRFPYAVGPLRTTVTNTAVFSRYPLSASSQIGEGPFDQWLTTIAVPRVGDVVLAAVHPCNPYCGGGQWAEQHDRLRQVVQDHLGGPLVVAGDFNAVDDHGPMLQLRRLGLRSATDLLGAGWLPTYPANQLIPPLLPIDHVLVTPQLTATSLRRVAVRGSDHLGLLTTVARAG